jgi:hypothetical protein
MRLRVLAVLAFVCLPILSYGQSSLTFPRVMTPPDFSTTGFALVNPGTAAAPVTFTLYGAGGTPLLTSPQTIPPRGQFARLASELFPAAANAGWVQASSETAGLHGFWFGGDLTTFADGAEAALSATELVLPLIGPQSQIHIVNTGAAGITVLLQLLGADGYDVALPFPQFIPAKGALSASLTTLFTSLEDLSLPTHMRVTCKCANANPFAATVVARNFLTSPSWIVSNGVPAGSSASKVYFPHLVDGPQGSAIWRSILGLTNLSATSSNNVEVTFVSGNGTVVRTVQQTLPPNGGLRLGARQLFQLTDGFQSGWVSAASMDGIPLTGYIAYTDTVAGGVAAVPAQHDADTGLLFAHIADLAPWLTGLALMNASAVPATAEVFALTPAGSLIGTTTLTIPPASNASRLLRDLLPQTQTRTSDGGFVFVRSDVPIFGIELFFSRNLQVLANVGAGRLAGIGFEPPR